MNHPIGFLYGWGGVLVVMLFGMVADAFGYYEQFEAFLNWVGRKLGAE